MSADREFLTVLVTRRFLTETETMSLYAKFKGDLYGMVLHLAEKKTDRKHELGRFWGDHLGVVYLDLSRTLFQSRLLERLPEEFARKNLIVPVYEFGGAVTVATPTPLDKSLLAQTESYLDAFVSPAFAFPDQVADALEIGYQSEVGLTQLLETTQIQKFLSSSRESAVSVAQLKEMAGDESIVKFTKGMMILALKQRASDIHIEPGAEGGRVRFRIDGVLQNVFHLEPALLPPIVTRLKVLASADIAERRMPQDGGIKLTLAERSVDLRFSSIPTIYGEKVVLRVLGSTKYEAVPTLKQLSFSQDVMRGIKRVQGHPNGIFLLTGPTGSGKTTTLYAMLQSLNNDGVNIVTIEDPVEYRLPGVNHMQVNPAAGLTFASALRAVLRQDPNVILIGEIRDTETAQIATRAALTGHLVLSTLHTTGAIEAISRLIDIGVEPYLLAPSLVGVMSQRLVRRLCDECKDRYKLTPEEVDRYFEHDGKTDVYFYRARGCERCGKIGYLGRLAIHELLVVDDDARTMIAQAVPLREIREWALQHGFNSLRYDGMKKVLRGLTTIEEVDRVTILE